MSIEVSSLPTPSAEELLSEVLATAPWSRCHPVAVDTNTIISDLLRRVRTGYTTLTALAQRRRVAIICPRHVEAELYEHVPRVAAKCQCDVDEVLDVLESAYLPLIRLVELPDHLPPDGRIHAVARRDADDVPLAHLATMLAPCLVLTGDRDLTDAGIGSPEWLDDILLLNQVSELDAQVWGVSHLTALAAFVPGASLWYLIRAITRSEIATGITLGLIVGGLLWYRPQLRSGVHRAWERSRPPLESALLAAGETIERQAQAHTALRAQLVTPILPPSIESTIARHLAAQQRAVSADQLHKELTGKGEQISVASLRRTLRQHPAFIGMPGRGYQLGRQPARARPPAPEQPPRLVGAGSALRR